MKHLSLILVIIIICLTNPAMAEDFSAQNQVQNQKSMRIIGILENAGLDSPYLVETVYFVDERVNDKHFEFTRGEFAGYNFTLRHPLRTPKLERLELNIRQEDSNYELNANHEKVMLRYHLEF